MALLQDQVLEHQSTGLFWLLMKLSVVLRILGSANGRRSGPPIVSLHNICPLVFPTIFLCVLGHIQ